MAAKKKVSRRAKGMTAKERGSLKKAVDELSQTMFGLFVPEPGVEYECEWLQTDGRCALMIFDKDPRCLPRTWCFEPGKDGVRWHHEGGAGV